MPLVVDFCGENSSIDDNGQLTIGREGDVRIDDNPFLHRVFLTISRQNGVWLIANVGSQLSATVSDPDGQMEAFLAPGGVIPAVFEQTRIAFTAGPSSYEVMVTNTEPTFRVAARQTGGFGETTIGPTKLTVDQMLLILSLAEPRLRGDGRAATNLPSSSEAAQRLGWKQTRFNRKLDNVCDKLTRAGVRGLRGTTSEVATGRRARLVEYAVATRLVQAEHLTMLDRDE